MAEKQKSEKRVIQGVVLSAICHKAKHGKNHSVTLTIQSGQTGRPVTVRIPTEHPPLPGTEVKVRGSIQQTPYMQFLQASGEEDLKLVSGQQGMILRDVTMGLLKHLGVQYDEAHADAILMDKNLDLCRVDDRVFLDLLENKLKIPHAKQLFDDNEDLFSETLSSAMLEGLQKIHAPFIADKKFENPFKKGTWPHDILYGAITRNPGGIDFLQIVDGKPGTQHTCMRKGSRLYLYELLEHDGIDNFFRALSIAVDEPWIYNKWLEDNRRDGMVTQAFLKDKQKEGVQLFTAEIMKRLETGFGIQQPEQVAARLGSMFQLNLPGIEGVTLIPQGAYQSSSRIATLAKMPSRKLPLGATRDNPEGLGLVPDTTGMDPYQADGLIKFVDGSPVVLVAGPPGSGKSHTISKFIQAAWQAGEDVVILTPTGKAAARLNMSFSQSFKNDKRPTAITFHAQMYSSDHKSKGFSIFALDQAMNSSANEMFPTRVDRAIYNTMSYNKQTKTKTPKNDASVYSDMVPPAILEGKIIMVDESSMLTNDHMALLFELRPKRVVFVGDPGQLPPVGAGKPFQDLIDLARQGYLPDKMALADLKIDHRATKELAECTKIVRGEYDDKGNLVKGGELPLDRVTAVDSSSDFQALAEDLLSKEFGIVESENLDGALSALHAVYEKELADEKPFYRFHPLGGYHQGKRDPDSINLVIPVTMAQELSSKRAAIPDIMTMGYTNDEVLKIASQIKQQLRPHGEGGSFIQHVSQFSPMVSNDLLPGDVIMQTTNDKAKIEYRTPQGDGKHSGTMNGESYVWIGSNIWVPLPSGNNTSDIEFKLNNLWAATGLRDVVMNEIGAGRGDDPNFHVELYDMLLNCKKDKEADQIRRMSLGEVFSLDVSQLLDLNLKVGEQYELQPDMIKRIVILPRLPSDKGMQNNDAGGYGLATKIYNVRQPEYVKKAGDVSDKDQYNDLASATSSNIGNFTVGEGYTVHKAQGSQGKMSITLVPPPFRPETAFQHEQGAYTAITRAKQRALVLVHGMTVDFVNKMWEDNRQRAALMPSANKAVALGMIPVLPDTLNITTVSLPHGREKIGSVYGSNNSKMEIYNQRLMMSSMGLPTDMDPLNVPHSHRSLAASTTPNVGAAASNTYSMPAIEFPDSDRLLAVPVSENNLQRKMDRMKWKPGMTENLLIKVTEGTTIAEQQEKLQAEADEGLKDLELDMDLF